ncbi:MAG: hypothetical protein IE937_02645 [Gammaproteobacteria bacterium]|nr:hypothetical protein [Gammaproteobacteria bacterium]
MATTAEILLTGLPGSGKSRIMQAVREQLGKEAMEVPSAENILRQPCQQVWCVVDARPMFDETQDAAALHHLAELLKWADGVVLNFSESADLSVQTKWSKWIKAQCALPIVRVTYGRFPEGWCGFETDDKSGRQSQTPLTHDQSPLQACRFDVSKIYLDHLLMGLDALRRNWGIKIWRVQGVFYTYEYVNRVQLEGTPFGLQPYAAEADVPGGWLLIQGVDLPEARLKELVDACQLSF